jgi:GT2 family glycosyltransferase
MEPVTIAITNYNGRLVLGDTLWSIRALDYPDYSIVLVDDGSTDDSVRFVREAFPEVRIIEMGRNTARLNKVRNRGIAATETRLVFLTDNDIVFAPDCLRILVDSVNSLPAAAVCTPRILFDDDHTKIYTDGNALHYVCASIAKNRNGKHFGASAEPGRSIGCGIQIIDIDKARSVGFFDEDYVMGWGDDGEFHHRLRLVGFQVYNVPQAVVYHKAIKGAPRIYGQILNRWYLMIQTYSAKTIALILPSLILYEAAFLFFALSRGYTGEYGRALRAVKQDWGRLMEKRRAVQARRVVPDRDLMGSGHMYIADNMVNKKFLKLCAESLDACFSLYWRVVKGLL